MSMNDPVAGYEAGVRILAAGGAESNDPSLEQLLGQLRNKGWLNQQEAERQARSLDDAKHAEEARQDHDKYTFPASHAIGLNQRSYGHLTITPNDATYTSPEENIHFLKNDIRETKVEGDGFYFIPTRGRKFLFFPVTEEGVINKTAAYSVALPPSVLGDAVVARWHFVQTGRETLGPSSESTPQQPPAADEQKTSEPAARVQEHSTPVHNSKPTPASLRAASTRATDAPTSVPVVQTDSSTIVPVSGQPTAAASSRTAVLHLYRLSHMGGEFSKYDIEIDGRRVAKIANAQSVRFDISPGKHNINVFWSSVKSDAPLYDMDFDPGKEYWVRVDLRQSYADHMRLAIVPEAEAREETGKLIEVAQDGSPGK
jgi:hypothetical protein